MLHWNEEDFEIPNLEEVLARHRKFGGAIIQYDRILSVIVYSRRSVRYEWVPNGPARFCAGIRNAFWCALQGWWSWTGLIVTPIFIFNNMVGGVDCTRMLTTPPPLPGNPQPDHALREVQRFERRRSYALFACLLVILWVLYFVIRHDWRAEFAP